MQIHVRRTGLGLVLALFASGACLRDEMVAPGDPGNSLASLTAAPLQSLGEDPPMIEIAEQVSTFGGFWFSEDATQIVVAVTNPADFQRVVPLIPQYLGSNKPIAGYVPVTVARSFADLARYRAALRSEVFALEGVVALGVKESANRVEVGITNPAIEAAVRGIVSTLGIPNEAVAVLTVPPLQLLSHTLRNQHPAGAIEGGWEIGPSGCTLGFPAIRANGAWVFVVNSHCTTISPGFDGGPFTQPFGGPQVGTELLDPPAFACGVFMCRYSDAALVSATATVNFGKIARTTERSTADVSGGPLTIDHANPTFTIRGRNNDVFENEPLDKVGRTTGWSHGNVEDTCTDWEYDGWHRLCSDRVDLAVDGGDSGSPVFSVLPDGTVQLRGVVFAKQGWPSNDAYMSDLRQIELDLGPLSVHRVLVGINGPTLMTEGAQGTWNASHTGGKAPYTYAWYRDGGLVSTWSSYTDYAGSTDFEVRLDVSDGLGDTGSYTILVQIWSNQCPPPEIIC